ncbi:rho guanine nucleotide exchange factor 28 isoform X2 [Lampris incognitus]|uniref:rho guanine nucleotide exchange factor 28 isoform X2 n=1 Tax=Lampris incognitus TaxID=2546036 RepID=UPI0024B57ECE|nr:rho guanine nucleotide exchange factor 28 isoform X2 [Lampris incognitus]
MDSDSDSPFNYSWPSFPKMRIRRKTGQKVKSQSIRESQPPSSTLAAAARLSAMIHGKDQVYANAMLVDQVEDVDIRYRHRGEEGASPVAQTGSPCWDSFAGSPPDLVNCFLNRHTSSSPNWEAERGVQGSGHQRDPSPHISPTSPVASSSSPSVPSSPLASAFRLLEGGLRRQTQPCRPVSPGHSHRTASLAEASRCLSPNLECDSGEEDILGHFHPSSSPRPKPILRSSSGEERDSFDTSPDFNRTHSDSTHKSTKKPEEAEVRLRSYSYSSPKAKPSRPQLNRDTAIYDLTEDGVYSSSGRSLLQALSLSKSLSRLNQVKERAFSLTETPREKRVLGFRKRAQSAEEESSASLQHLTLTEFLKEIEDEEWDKYIIPSKVESEKYKVSRTFSFLKNRMSSTRNKTKVKGKEAKEKPGTANGHHFVAVSLPGLSLCVACDKPVTGKELLQCSSCSLAVHKGCRESVSACGKKPQEKNAVTLKNKSSTPPQNSVVKDSSSSSLSSSSSFTTTAARDRRETGAPQYKSPSISIDSSLTRRLSDVVMADSETSMSNWGSGSLTEEGTPTTATPPSTDPPIGTDEPVEAPLLSDLSADLLGLEAESWSLAVSPEFCRRHDKHTVKRQDVIYELMQTELHHIQTLTVMSEVFRRGMLEELQMDWDCVARIFPCLDPLLLFHRNLFGALQERRQASTQLENTHNYLIPRIGDILLQQFSDENAEKMKQVYGEFCSHHTEAVNVFKELQQQNKKLQLFVKQQSNNSLVRRREVPEFILLVTQRITKYPVLLERIIQYTQEGSQEHTDLSHALAQIRDVIAAVNLSVSKYERGQELQEVLARLENKSLAKLKNGKVFRKQDLRSQHRSLQHKGLVYWKTATGRLKDTLALLLTDILVFLQEKDQRFVFAAVDQKPPVIPLQKLIVREVANEERGMFLISASSVGPEMYEVHTTTREERNAWMKHIRQAVESCPEEEEEEERSAESEELKRVAEARVQKIHKFQETLLGQDQRICSSLEEKLQLYAELTELTLRSTEPVPQRHLLVQLDTDVETSRQASTLLAAALKEAEKLIAILQTCDTSCIHNKSSPGRGPEFCSYTSHGSIQESPSEPDYLSTVSVSSTSLVSDEWAGQDGLLWSPAGEPRRGDLNGTQLKVAEGVQSLTQLLYSLQAAITLQDSCYEVQKLLLLEGERPQLCTIAPIQNNQEQERLKSISRRREEAEKKSMERKREEGDGVQRLHTKLKQEQQRWDRECVIRDRQQSEQESLLEERERRCHLEAERLRCEREALEAQRQEYQQNLDRLREGQRSVEREKEKVEAQQRLFQNWRHGRQSSLPVLIPLDGYQLSGHNRSGSLGGDCSVYENEAALLHSLQQTHLPSHHHHLLHINNQHQSLHSGLLKNQDVPLHGTGLAPGRGLSPSLYNSLNTLLNQAHSKQPPADGPTYPKNAISHSGPQPTSSAVHPLSAQPRRTNSNVSPALDGFPLGSWRAGVTGLGLYEDDYPSSASLTPLLTPEAYLFLEGQNGEDGGEENIVYL